MLTSCSPLYLCYARTTKKSSITWTAIRIIIMMNTAMLICLRLKATLVRTLG